MRFGHLDLNLLVALDALLTERSITLAGQQLHLSQSAVSAALGRLRDYFGDELLVQAGRRMVPTAVGAELAEPVRKILLEIQATVATRPAFDPAASDRRFSLMMSDYVALVLMVDVVERVAKLAPGISFELIHNNVMAPGDHLDHADIDLLIMLADVVPGGHPKERLFVDDYVCIAWTGNKEIGNELSLEDYLTAGHVILQWSRGRALNLDEFVLSKMGLERRIEVIAMNFGMLPNFVVGTHRLATVQRRLAQYYIKTMPLKILEAPLDLPVLDESVHWNAAFVQDPACRWLRQILREVSTDVAPPAAAKRPLKPPANKRARRSASGAS
jgi:LysR family transcriptional regulator, nod-box dependent transcriptional activator